LLLSSPLPCTAKNYSERRKGGRKGGREVMRVEGKEKRMEIKGCIRVVQVLRGPMCHALKWYFSVAGTSRKSGIVSVGRILHVP
jgi:hypothetical protein